jgi:glycosyltransferase involved in cell wall biosynthesis
MSLRHLNSEGVVVTVAMPIYNAGVHLRLAVLSIVAQTFERWELLIIDDGSTDNALQTITDIRDPRIRIFRDGRNKGLAVRLNEACAMAIGQYLARMDQDDVSYPERLRLQVEALQADPGLDLVAGRAIIIDENNGHTGMFAFAGTHAEICAQPWRGFVFPHPAWMGRIEWFLKHRYAEPAPYFCEDQELLLRTYRQSRFLALDRVVLAYRIRAGVNWAKLAATRRAMLAMQWRLFGASAMWRQAMLALLAYFAKSGLDLLQRTSGADAAQGGGPLDVGVAGEWTRILGGLELSHPQRT